MRTTIMRLDFEFLLRDEKRFADEYYSGLDKRYYDLWRPDLLQEHEWIDCKDFLRMVCVIRAATHALSEEGISANRKLRMFHCATARQEIRIHATQSQLVRGAIMSELLGDNAIDKRRNDHQNLQSRVDSETRQPAVDIYANFPTLHLAYACCNFLNLSYIGFLEAMESTAYTDEQIDRSTYPDYLRDLVDTPFQPQPAFDPGWNWANHNRVFRLAQDIYYDYRFDRMPELGVALKQAGCTQQQILDHCDSKQPHVRGCWVVDSIIHPDFCHPQRYLYQPFVPGDRLREYIQSGANDPFSLYRG